MDVKSFLLAALAFSTTALAQPVEHTPDTRQAVAPADMPRVGAAINPAWAQTLIDPGLSGQETPAGQASLDATRPSGGLMQCTSGIDYIPLPHFLAGSYQAPEVQTSGLVSWKEKGWPNNPKEVSALLPNVATEISLRRQERTGSWWFSANQGSTQVIVDFIKYRSEPLTTAGGPSGTDTHGHARVGVGLRVRIDIDSSRVEASGSLLALAANMRASRSQGRISMELMGIDSAKAVQAMPFTADVSEASIQRVIEAAAVVKSLLTEADTQLTPQTLARIECAGA